MTTFMEAAEFELIHEEQAVFCRSGKEAQGKEHGERKGGMRAPVLSMVEGLLQTSCLDRSQHYPACSPPLFILLGSN